MSVRFKDYYEILGVDRGATDAQIKKAFRDLARRYHPDVSKELDADRRFKEINEAYEVLKDAEKRQRYDALGAGYHDGQSFEPPPGWQDAHFEFGGGSGGPADFSDFFSALFGARGMGGAGAAGFQDLFGGAGGGRGRPRRGADVEAELRLSLAELDRGGKKSVALRDEAGGVRQFEVGIPPGTTDGTRIRLQFGRK